MVVDQPATIGALAVAVALDMGITVGHLSGLSMRRIVERFQDRREGCCRHVLGHQVNQTSNRIRGQSVT